MPLMPVCLALAQAVVAVLPTDAFTLLWTHSVERTEWREEWRIEDGRLHVVAATVAGSGAGMEPPPGAVLVDNAWHYVPAVPPMARLRLATSQSGGDYRLCWDEACRPLASLLPGSPEEPIELYPCEAAKE